MEYLVVGGNDCKFEQIVTTIEMSPAVGIFHNKFFDVALKLETSHELISRLQRDILMFGTKTYTIGLFEILQEWRSRESKNATLGKLLHILNQAGLVDSEQLLRNAFARPSGAMNLDRRDQGIQGDVDIKALVEKQGKHITLVMPELMLRTTWNSMITAEMRSRKILEQVDCDFLESLQNPTEKVKTLFTMIEKRLTPKRPGLYEEIITVFTKLSQSGVVYLLEDM